MWWVYVLTLVGPFIIMQFAIYAYASASKGHPNVVDFMTWTVSVPEIPEDLEVELNRCTDVYSKTLMIWYFFSIPTLPFVWWLPIVGRYFLPVAFIIFGTMCYRRASEINKMKKVRKLYVSEYGCSKKEFSPILWTLRFHLYFTIVLFALYFFLAFTMMFR